MLDAVALGPMLVWAFLFRSFSSLFFPQIFICVVVVCVFSSRSLTSSRVSHTLAHTISIVGTDMSDTQIRMHVYTYVTMVHIGMASQRLLCNNVYGWFVHCVRWISRTFSRCFDSCCHIYHSIRALIAVAPFAGCSSLSLFFSVTVVCGLNHSLKTSPNFSWFSREEKNFEGNE